MGFPNQQQVHNIGLMQVGQFPTAALETYVAPILSGFVAHRTFIRVSGAHGCCGSSLSGWLSQEILAWWLELVGGWGRC